MYLLGTAALYFSVYAVLNILFNVIDASFPDPLNFYYQPSSAVRWSLSLIIVIFPVYFWVSRFLTKEILVNPEKSEIKVRRWLLYLTVFLAAALLIGDLVALIFNFLEGDFTTPFILKVLAVFIVGAKVFWYYLYEIRRKPKEFSPAARRLVWIACFAVLAVIVAGFFVAGSPFRQRLVRFDGQKINDLSGIQWQIVNYWQQKGKLPVALGDLRDDISGYAPSLDPQTKEPYEYSIRGELSFELCADFNLPSSDAQKNSEPYARPVGPYGETGESWDHDAGRHCFSRTIDPEIYRVNEGAQLKTLPL